MPRRAQSGNAPSPQPRRLVLSCGRIGNLCSRALFREQSPASAAGGSIIPQVRHRTLVATLDPPWPAISGAELRNSQIAAAAASLGPVGVLSVTVAPPGVNPPANIVPYAMTARPAGSLHELRPTSAETDRVLPPEAAAGLARAVADFAPDTLVIEHPALLPLAVAGRRAGTKLVMDMHNVESTLAERLARAQPFFAIGARRDQRAAARASARHEREALTKADAVWVCSAEEAERLPKNVGGAAVHVVPNGIPRPDSAPGIVKPANPRGPGAITLFFAGHLGYQPNVAAALWLVKRILPLAGRDADLRVVLAGRSPAPAVRALAENAAVSVVADPPSLDAVLAAADIAVLPLRIGGGTRIKALEAMSRGIPLAATPFAVEGLGLVDGQHYAAATTTRAFARTILRLAEEPDIRTTLAAAAFRHCVANFGPSAIVRAVRRGLTAP